MAAFFEEIGNYLNGFIDTIIEILTELGEALLRLFVYLFNFSLNILRYFQIYADKYNQDPNVVGFSYLIEKEIQSGNANVIRGIIRNPQATGAVVKGFYNTATKKIYKEDVAVDEFTKLDGKTKDEFGDKKLIIIE
jgi:hypothetical protein